MTTMIAELVCVIPLERRAERRLGAADRWGDRADGRMHITQLWRC
jgi:hypothetical protein